MDSLLEKLDNVEVTSHPNNPNAEHPRYSQYKSKITKSCQEERRREILEARKGARYDLLNHLRQLEECENISDEEDSEDKARKGYVKPKEYRDFVMLSEWLVEVPGDFSEKYLSIPCPVGKRCLCVCYKGWTNIYAKNGKRIKQFVSCLPGGSKNTYKYGFTVLDCIWSERNRTFYILDLVFWAKCSYIDCDTEFRFSWMKSRISEWDHDVSVVSSSNNYSFVPVPYFECSKSLESLFTASLLSEVDLDGVLFYHRDTHYIHGPSPLVCWLKPFMLADMLGVSVPQKYLDEKPRHYTDISSHIEEYNEERKLIHEKRKAEKCKKMVTETTE